MWPRMEIHLMSDDDDDADDDGGLLLLHLMFATIPKCIV